MTVGRTDISPADFAVFLGISKTEATAILKQEARETAASGNLDVHNGYDYQKQEWVTA